MASTWSRFRRAPLVVGRSRSARASVLPTAPLPTLAVLSWSLGIVTILLVWAVSQKLIREADLSRSCRGEPDACRVLAQAYERGDGRVPDTAATIELFERACEVGDDGSCRHLVEMPAALSSRKLLTYLEWACRAGSALRCAQLGSIYYEGGGIGIADVPRDLGRALAFFRSACDRGHATACFNESAMSYEGEGTDRDLARAARLAQKACSLGDGDGCQNFGHQTYFGEGVGQSRRLALWNFQKACERGRVAGCDSLAELNLHGEWNTARPDVAAGLWRRGCADPDSVGWSCLALGRLKAAGKGVTRDPAEARELYRAAERRLNLLCVHHRASACLGLALVFAKGLGVPHDFARAAGLFDQACRSGDSIGCFYVGRSMRDGQGVERNPVEAAARFAGACTNGAAQGCVALAKMLRDGEGVPPDPKRARRLLRRACRAEYSTGCRELPTVAERAVTR